MVVADFCRAQSECEVAGEGARGAVPDAADRDSGGILDRAVVRYFRHDGPDRAEHTAGTVTAGGDDLRSAGERCLWAGAAGDGVVIPGACAVGIAVSERAGSGDAVAARADDQCG